ncbi:MAG: FAD binding domain-containing protein [Pseudomonadota bacterium]
MIRFLLNDETISTELPPGMVLLDFLRQEKRLVGVKEGCREGDCGACMVLVGEPDKGGISYRAVNSCLFPLGDVEHRHVVTIEGLNSESLSLVQQAFVEEGATQCGFCTPGFIVSLAGFLLSSPDWSTESGLDSVAGNICRCTGHVSIRRAVGKICKGLGTPPKAGTPERLRLLISAGLIPKYISKIPTRLSSLPTAPARASSGRGVQQIGGGTDVYVQRPEALLNARLNFLSRRKDLQGIRLVRNRVVIGGGTPWADLEDSPIFRKIFPESSNWFQRMASRPIRNRATVGGNIVNASPIADVTILLLALDADLTLIRGKAQRRMKLRDLYVGYKKLRKKPDEIVKEVSFERSVKGARFSFEKVCRRANLDIASVNSAMSAVVWEGRIDSIHLSAGGVAPIPLYLRTASEALCGERLTATAFRKALDQAEKEISPISDVRGSANYKRTLLRRLLTAHFFKLAPELGEELTT